MKSRRAFLVEPGKLLVKEVEVNPTPEQLLIKVSVCGLCNWELNHYRGHLGECPQPLGHEWAGIVVEAGANITRFTAGDAVTGYGSCGFSDYITVFENDCFKLDKNVNLQHALGEPLKCIVTVVRAAAPEAGDYGVVVGCGPMGLWCIQAMAGNLLSALIAVDIDDKKLALAKKYGATHVINSGREEAAAIISKITCGRMADFVIEGTGIPDLVNTTVNYIKTGRGRIILMSSHEKAARDFDFRGMIDKGAEIRVPHPSYSVNQHDDMRRTVNLINNGVFKMDEIISHKFTLEDIQSAFENLDKKPKDYIKGVVLIELS